VGLIGYLKRSALLNLKISSYEACPESKDTNVFNMYNIFNLQKRHYEWTLFFNIVAGIVQTFIKPWEQRLYPRVIEVCRLPFESRHDFFLHLIIVVELFASEIFLSSSAVEVTMSTLISNWYTDVELIYLLAQSQKVGCFGRE